MSNKNKRIGPKLILLNGQFALGKMWSISKPVFTLYIGNTLIEALVPLAQAYIAGSLVGELAKITTGEASRDRLLTLVVIAAALQLLSIIAHSLKRYYLYAKREQVEMELTDSLMRAQTSLPMEVLELPETRDNYTHAQTGVSEMFWYVDAIMSLLGGLIGAAGVLILVAATVPWATLILMLLPFISVSLKYRNYLAWRNMWEEQRSNRIRADSVSSMLGRESGILEVRMFGLLEKLLTMWRKETTIAVNVRLKDEARNETAAVLINIFESAVGVAVDIWLVFQVFAGSVSITVFEQTRRLVNNYVLSLSRISNSLSNIVLYGYRINDYRTFLSPPIETSASVKVGRPQSLEMNAVSFSYPTGQSLVLEKVNLRFTPGQTVAIVGENGAGKTTLFKLLLGMYTPTSGQVAYNDVDLQTIDKTSLYKQVTPLFQEFERYDFLSLGQSVTIAGNKNNRQRLQQVLKLVGMWDFVQQQPKKLKTNLGYVEDDGIKLSGGQWQRLAIARSLYKNAPILILDEPTSAIDAKSEQQIMEEIFAHYQDQLLITVSHRLSTVARADRIIVLKNGKVVEDGSHKQLWKKGTAYYDLFHKQATPEAHK